MYKQERDYSGHFLNSCAKYGKMADAGLIGLMALDLSSDKSLTYSNSNLTVTSPVPSASVSPETLFIFPKLV